MSFMFSLLFMLHLNKRCQQRYQNISQLIIVAMLNYMIKKNPRKSNLSRLLLINKFLHNKKGNPILKASGTSKLCSLSSGFYMF